MKYRLSFISLFVLVITSSANLCHAQLGDWMTHSIEETYGHSICIGLSNKDILKDAANLTLIEKKPGKYRDFKYDISYFGKIQSKQLSPYLYGMYHVLGECIVNDTVYVRIQTSDSKTVFLIPKDFMNDKIVRQCYFPDKIMVSINDFLTKYHFIEKEAYNNVFGITEYNDKGKTIYISKPYHRLGKKTYAKVSFEDYNVYDASITFASDYGKVHFKEPKFHLSELEKLINGHALLTDDEMNDVLQHEASMLDSAKALFNPKENIEEGKSIYHKQFMNYLVHLVGQQIMYCGYTSDSYTPGDIYTVDSVLPYENTFDPIRLYISNQNTGKVQILSGKENDLNNSWSVVKHVEYLKDSLVGREFIYNWKESSSYSDPILQVGSKRQMKEVPTNTVWKCIDVRNKIQPESKEYYANVIIIFENDEYGQGYLFEWSNISKMPEFKYLMTDKKEYDAKIQADQKAKQDRIAKLSAKYGKANAKLISEGKVRLGMTKEMCIEAWGEPYDINVSIGSWGRHEQWVYGKIYSSYLYFENGKLTAIQD